MLGGGGAAGAKSPSVDQRRHNNSENRLNNGVANNKINAGGAGDQQRKNNNNSAASSSTTANNDIEVGDGSGNVTNNNNNTDNVCVDILLNWLLNVYDGGRTGKMRLLSFQTLLIIVANASIEEKAKVLFRAAMNVAKPHEKGTPNRVDQVSVKRGLVETN